MNILGWEITRTKKKAETASAVHGWRSVFDSFTGAWQQDVQINQDSVLAFSTVYACITLIAQDVAKLGLRLVRRDQDGIWQEADNSPFIPVLKKPNRYQTRIKFIEQWVTSKLIHGNTYVLKQRDRRGVVRALYVLDPVRVTPLVATDGSVFYELKREYLAELEEERIRVPASEIIHDRMVCLYHPLIGVSPIFACGLAATQGLAIQKNSTKFFENGSQPGGILTAPGAISDETAVRLREHWNLNYSGENAGKVAVVGDGLKYEAMTMTAVDAQTIEQLKWTAESIPPVFHVPSFKVGIGPMPTYQNAAVLNQIYYSDCLQSIIESLELSLDEGLELPNGSGTEFDLDDLMRMDTETLYKSNSEGIKGGWLSPNEARRRANKIPVAGGESPLMQQQNWSLAQLATREIVQDSPSVAAPEMDDIEDQERLAAALLHKELADADYS
jgi:HK97 family phage portal protein